MENIYINYIKRGLDVIGSVLLIIVLLPLIVLISLLLFINCRGSIIFKQRRLGKNSKPFYIYKFRSMVKDAPNVPSIDLDGSIYVTKLGSFLRKTSLDELPQLINILKGEMSFVGPRPFIPNEGIIINLRKEHSIDTLRPGLTGWAQVIARETSDQNLKFKLELYYLRNISIKLDIIILFRTFFSIRGK